MPAPRRLRAGKYEMTVRSAITDLGMCAAKAERLAESIVSIHGHNAPALVHANAAMELAARLRRAQVELMGIEWDST